MYEFLKLFNSHLCGLSVLFNRPIMLKAHANQRMQDYVFFKTKYQNFATHFNNTRTVNVNIANF